MCALFNIINISDSVYLNCIYSHYLKSKVVLVGNCTKNDFVEIVIGLLCRFVIIAIINLNNKFSETVFLYRSIVLNFFFFFFYCDLHNSLEPAFLNYAPRLTRNKEPFPTTVQTNICHVSSSSCDQASTFTSSIKCSIVYQTSRGLSDQRNFSASSKKAMCYCPLTLAVLTEHFSLANCFVETY